MAPRKIPLAFQITDVKFRAQEARHPVNLSAPPAAGRCPATCVLPTDRAPRAEPTGGQWKIRQILLAQFRLRFRQGLKALSLFSTRLRELKLTPTRFRTLLRKMFCWQRFSRVPYLLWVRSTSLSTTSGIPITYGPPALSPYVILFCNNSSSC